MRHISFKLTLLLLAFLHVKFNVIFTFFHILICIPVCVCMCVNVPFHVTVLLHLTETGTVWILDGEVTLHCLQRAPL